MFWVFDWWLYVNWLKSHRIATYCIDFNNVINSYFEDPSVSGNGAMSAKTACCSIHSRTQRPIPTVRLWVWGKRLDTDESYSLKLLTLLRLEPKSARRTWSISKMLVHWLLASPCHRQSGWTRWDKVHPVSIKSRRLSSLGVFYYKRSHDCLVFIMRILILFKRRVNIKTGPWLLSFTRKNSNCLYHLTFEKWQNMEMLFCFVK